jgi:hypothetical protein
VARASSPLKQHGQDARATGIAMAQTFRKIAWLAWCGLLAAGFAYFHSQRPSAVPPERAAFEEQHRVCYDVYATSDISHAYDLLALAFDGEELDRQFCVYARALEQMRKAGADVTVWDLSYQDFRVLESDGERCTVYSKWNVVYVLGHSRHSHVRSNVYEVVFELRHGAGGWKIVDSRIQSETNVARASRLPSSVGPASLPAGTEAGPTNEA